MDKNIFSGTAQVEIQGSRVLRFIELTKDEAKFEIIGLSEPKIQVIDKRPAVRRTMARILKTGKVEKLVQYFNKPARVTMNPSDDGKMTICLDKTRAKQIKHMLWIAIGVGNEIPYYEDYVYIKAKPLEEETFALCYLFKKVEEGNRD